jgi:hypothetical protein
MSDDDFPLPVADDEWTWIDDLAFAARVIVIIVTVVSAVGVLAWVVSR